MKASLDNPEVVEEICARIIAGEAVSVICRDANMPSERAVYLKMANDEEFCRIIARAREAQQEKLIDYTIDLANSATPETVNVVKLQIWAHQWRAGKLSPRKYGDRQAVELTGANGTPLQVQVYLPDNGRDQNS